MKIKEHNNVKEFLEITDCKIVKIRHEPKSNSERNFCVDNSFDYTEKNIGWRVAVGWVWKESHPDEFMAHAWVVKRKKHKDITPLTSEFDLYLYSEETTALTYQKDYEWKSGQIKSEWMHPSYRTNVGWYNLHETKEFIDYMKETA